MNRCTHSSPNASTRYVKKEHNTDSHHSKKDGTQLNIEPMMQNQIHAAGPQSNEHKK